VALRGQVDNPVGAKRLYGGPQRRAVQDIGFLVQLAPRNVVFTVRLQEFPHGRPDKTQVAGGQQLLAVLQGILVR
jgi:hypothetical protein